MLQYKIFIKDCLDLTGMAIANTTCTSFEISRDLLSVATANIEVLEMPENIKEGDILGIIDPYGTIIYTGVITSFDSAIQCEQALSIFNDNWLWHEPTGTIENKIKKIITDDFINSDDTLLAEKFPFNIVVESSTRGSFKKEETPYTCNFQDFLFEIYSQYGVIVEVNIPFEAVTPTITIKKATHVPIKIGNNMAAIRNLTPFTEIFETNKLVIYNDEGTTLRQTYYGTVEGTTDDPDDPLRLPVIKTEYVFDTETPVDEILEANLQEEMLNHKITFDLILGSELYNFYDWELGMPIHAWYNGQYFDTVYTGFTMITTETSPLSQVNITCGTVRNKLTQIMNGR